LERANLSMRMAMRRFTRLTNVFSKKLNNHAHMVALYVLWYNFFRVHKTLRTSPAMAAGIETSRQSMNDIVFLIERREDFRSGALAGRVILIMPVSQLNSRLIWICQFQSVTIQGETPPKFRHLSSSSSRHLRRSRR